MLGAADRNRTGTVLPPRDFKSLASACSATAANFIACPIMIYNLVLLVKCFLLLYVGVFTTFLQLNLLIFLYNNIRISYNKAVCE